MFKTIIITTLAVAVFAEPPVGLNGNAPSNQYGLPSSPSSGFSNQFGSPSNQYGVPGAEELSNNGRFSSSHRASEHSGGYPSSGYERSGINGEENSEPANYEFQYDIEDQEQSLKFGHKENRQGDEANGYYYVLLPDGRTQHVEYQADQNGYRPKISYEEAQEGYGRGGPGSGYVNSGQELSSRGSGGYQIRK